MVWSKVKGLLARLGVTTEPKVRRWLEEVAYLGGAFCVAYNIGALWGFLGLVLLLLGFTSQLVRQSSQGWNEFYELGKQHGKLEQEMETLNRDMAVLNQLRARLATQYPDEPWRGNEPPPFSD